MATTARTTLRTPLAAPTPTRAPRAAPAAAKAALRPSLAAPLAAPARAARAGRVGSVAVRANKQIQIEVDKPLNLQLAPSKAAGGGLVVKGVRGNAAQAGLSVGDTIVYASSFFGDELWPTDDLNFTRSALAAAPSPVVLVYVKGENTSVNVKRLPKKPAPPRFGRKLTAAQKALATHICVDCGWVYCEKTPFAEAAKAGLKCEQCGAPPRRFATFNVDTGKIVGGTPDALATNLTVVIGLLGVGVLAWLGLSL